MIFTIFIFLIIILGLGYSLMYITKVDCEDPFIWSIMVVGIGLSVFAVLGVFFNIFGIPLHYGVFVAISLIIPIWSFVCGNLIFGTFRERNIFRKIEGPQVITIYEVLVLLCFVLVFGMMLIGSFSYPYLEDDDPWGHAEAAKYISVSLTANEPDQVDYHYIDPYPPSYDILMGVMHQSNDSISWTLKFFNSLLCGFAILFFYALMMNFVNDKKVALTATFILAMSQSFMSHFIWSQSYLIPLLIISFYCLNRVSDDWKWIIPGTISIAAVFLTQPSGAVVFILMFGTYWFARVTINGIWSEFDIILTFIIGGLISALYWIVMLGQYGFSGLMKGVGFYTNMVSGIAADTSEGLIYFLKDFIFPPILSRMDQPIGIGIVLSLLLVISFGYIIWKYKWSRRSIMIRVALFWLVLCFLGVQGNALPWKLMPHRFWVFLAIPIAMISSEFIKFIYMVKKDSVRVMLIGVFVLLILVSSGIPKYLMQTASWRQGSGILDEELNGFNQLKLLPPNTRVFVYQMGRDMIAIGYDKYSPEWESEVIEFRKNIRFVDKDDFEKFFDDIGYEYMLMSKIDYDIQYEEMKDWFDQIYFEDEAIVIWKI